MLINMKPLKVFSGIGATCAERCFVIHLPVWASAAGFACARAWIGLAKFSYLSAIALRSIHVLVWEQQPDPRQNGQATRASRRHHIPTDKASLQRRAHMILLRLSIIRRDFAAPVSVQIWEAHPSAV